MKFLESYVYDEGGYLYIGWVTALDDDMELILELFRRNYIRKENNPSTDEDLENGYRSHICEMEAYNVDSSTNRQEFDEAIRIWGSKLPGWVKNSYKNSEYKSHRAFRDCLHEGIYESLSEFMSGYLYWYHG